MPSKIEDYAVVGNCETMALVGRDGSIDWLGMPRFDSAACFAALLGGPGHGRWLIAPVDEVVRTTRRYRGDTMILETVVETQTGTACVIDFLTRREGVSDLVRIVRGLRGRVAKGARQAVHEAMAVRADEAKVGLSCVASTFFQRVHVMNVQKRTRLNSGVAYFGFRVELAIVAKELSR